MKRHWCNSFFWHSIRRKACIFRPWGSPCSIIVMYILLFMRRVPTQRLLLRYTIFCRFSWVFGAFLRLSSGLVLNRILRAVCFSSSVCLAYCLLYTKFDEDLDWLLNKFIFLYSPVHLFLKYRRFEKSTEEADIFLRIVFGERSTTHAVQTL